MTQPGEMFKHREGLYRRKLPAKSIFGLRLDGKAFHTFTKQFEKPYDLNFMGHMDAVAEALIERHLPGVLIAYVQSDEITLIFTDRQHENSQYLFDGETSKLLSVIAASATAEFMKRAPGVEGLPIFDARLFELDTEYEVQNYLDWRRADARRNSVTMAAETLVTSHRELEGMPQTERYRLLEGTHLATLPDGFFHGRLLYNVPEDLGHRLRSRWFTTAATRFVTASEVTAAFQRIYAAEALQAEARS